ncbi:MAG TPA: APC family permease [Puia sp.]|uniref:APC family permease n=1 Tax=Puia sp. TaxID=2045100 RepID=UPI002CAAE1B4|nr:APC family permease [Puia sp.]HVU99613.1 APC family permease [Puia sp.]
MRQTSKNPPKLRLLHLAAIIFFTVSGGPYGLESLFAEVGNHGALLLLLVTPLLWDVPTILTVLELNSLMPITGGYYQWVKHALGIRWAFFEGWWTWLYTFCDLAIYPVLFITYAAYFVPDIAHYKIPVCLAIIWSSAILNIIGVIPVGRASLIFSVCVLIPFLFAFGLAFQHGGAPIPAPSLNGAGYSSLGMGLYYVMWNFLGWDNATTYAGEVNRPVRTYFISVCIAFLITLGIYFIAALAVARSGISLEAIDIEKGGFPVLGAFVGGRWLGILVATGGMASALGLYSAVLLSVSRVPQVMADDRLLPSFLCTRHPRFGTPYVSIIASSVIVSVLILFTFGDLVVMDIILYGAGLSLEFIALLILRIKEPDRPRPFRIPLGRIGLGFLFLLPLAVYVLALTGAISSESSGRMAVPVTLAIILLLSAAPAWWLTRWRKPHMRS